MDTRENPGLAQNDPRLRTGRKHQDSREVLVRSGGAFGEGDLVSRAMQGRRAENAPSLNALVRYLCNSFSFSIRDPGMKLPLQDGTLKPTKRGAWGVGKSTGVGLCDP